MAKATKNEAGFRPIGDLIAVRPNKVDKSKGGVVLPERSQGFTQNAVETPSGVALAVGPDVKHVKPGDTILAAAATPGCKVNWKGKDMVMLHESDIVGIDETTEE